MDTDDLAFPPIPEQVNRWHEVKDDPTQYGPEHDFEVITVADGKVWWPVSRAAIEWSNKNVPDWLDRFGARGYKMKDFEISRVIQGARRDNLLSREDYENRMNEEQDLRNQRHD